MRDFKSARKCTEMYKRECQKCVRWKSYMLLMAALRRSRLLALRDFVMCV